MAKGPQFQLSVPTGGESLRGIGVMLAAYIVATLGEATIKWVLPQVGPAIAMISRGVIGGITVALLVRGRGLFPQNKKLLIWRGLIRCCAAGITYWVWSRGLPLVDTYAVLSIAPLLMTLLAIPILGEKAGWQSWVATLVGCVGVLIMLQPSGDLWRIEAFVLLFGAGLLALTRVWSRALSASDSAATITFWLMMAHIPFGLLLLPVFPPTGDVMTTNVLLLLVVFGILNGIAQLLFARAFALAPISVLAPFEYSPLLFGGVLGFIIWADVPAWTTLYGVALVAVAGLYTVYRTQRRRAAERAAANAKNQAA
jgi:drug/metabolite transporter (DMT)-like permease